MQGNATCFQKKWHVTQQEGTCKGRLHRATVLPKHRQHFEQFAPRQLLRPFFPPIGPPVHLRPLESATPRFATDCLCLCNLRPSREAFCFDFTRFLIASWHGQICNWLHTYFFWQSACLHTFGPTDQKRNLKSFSLVHFKKRLRFVLLTAAVQDPNMTHNCLKIVKGCNQNYILLGGAMFGQLQPDCRWKRASLGHLAQMPEAGVKWCGVRWPMNFQSASFLTLDSATYPAASMFATSSQMVAWSRVAPWIFCILCSFAAPFLLLLLSFSAPSPSLVLLLSSFAPSLFLLSILTKKLYTLLVVLWRSKVLKTSLVVQCLGPEQQHTAKPRRLSRPKTRGGMEKKQGLYSVETKAVWLRKNKTSNPPKAPWTAWSAARLKERSWKSTRRERRGGRWRRASHSKGRPEQRRERGCSWEEKAGLALSKQVSGKPLYCATLAGSEIRTTHREATTAVTANHEGWRRKKKAAWGSVQTKSEGFLIGVFNCTRLRLPGPTSRGRARGGARRHKYAHFFPLHGACLVVAEGLSTWGQASGKPEIYSLNIIWSTLVHPPLSCVFQTGYCITICPIYLLQILPWCHW